MNSLVKMALSVLLMVLASDKVNAQPAKLDLRHCNKLAANELRICLEDSRNGNNQHCWRQSKQGYHQCVVDIKRRFKDNDRQIDNHKTLSRKAQRQLDKRLKANKISIRLMAAANIVVYQSVLEAVIDDFAQKQQQKLTATEATALQNRLAGYRRYLSLVEQQLSCQQIKQALSDVADREVSKLAKSYCRLI